MSQTANRLSRASTIRRPGARKGQGKTAIAISVLAFFAAIAVVVWFALSTFGTGNIDNEGASAVVLPGGASGGSSGEGSLQVVRDEAVGVDDGYLVGDFGDPVDELYADDSDGGWGEAALDSAEASHGAN